MHVEDDKLNVMKSGSHTDVLAPSTMFKYLLVLVCHSVYQPLRSATVNRLTLASSEVVLINKGDETENTMINDEGKRANWPESNHQ
jgi:hypothetical protein